MATASPTVEALEAEETEEEKNIDELDSALEASEKKVEAELTDEELAAAEAAKAVEGKTEEELAKEAADKEAADAAAAKAAEEEKKDKEPTAQELLEQQNIELRQLLREQKKEMTVLKAKVGRVETGLKDTMEDDDKKLPDLSEVEQLQANIAQIGQEKGTLFETLVEAMEVKSEYADIREVCSREHFDDIFEEVGKAVAIREKIDPTVAALALEAEVWQMDNPYKYMYEIIKEHHPKYAKEEPEKKEPEEKKEPADPEKKKEPVDAPTSLASVGGSDADTKSGWNTKRIDNLDEDELDKVPDEVYQKYLRGELE